MNATSHPFRVARLFFATIGKRLVLAFVSKTPPETMDADGNYQTVVFRRPGAGESIGRGDYDAVRADLIQRRHLKSFRTEWVFVAVAAVFCGALMLEGGGNSWLAVLALTPLLCTTVLAAGIRTYIRSTRLEVDEVALAGAWMRRGCCPHCIYRLPEHAPTSTVRCSECGLNWRPVQFAESAR